MSITLDTLFLEYDCQPLLSICHDEHQQYLAIAVDEDPGGEDLYIYVPVTDSRVGELERGDVTLLEAIVGVGNTQVFYGTERGPDTAKSINAADLPDNWLPEAPASLMAKLPFSAPPPSSWSSATTPSS